MNSFYRVRTGVTRVVVTVAVLLLVSVLRAGSALHYSTSNVDEHFVVPFAVGFLDFDLNPRWFFYHTLPMYIIAGMYTVLYWCFDLTGLVHSKVEFASLLFENDAVFYASARLLVSCIHTLGAFVLALIVHRHYRSSVGAALVFAAAILIPDSVLAANYVRVDSFVFLFLCLLIFFSCYGDKTRRNLIFSIIACAAAIASKLPALVFFPILLVSLFLDIRQRHYPTAYLAYTAVGVPLLALAFMPYVALDFATYQQQVLHKVFNMAAGTYTPKVAKAYYHGTLTKLVNLYHLIAAQVGVLSVVGTGLAGIYALVRRDRRLGFVLLFALAYTAAFATSASVDSYWLRPVYPIYIFLTLVFVIEISRHERCAALLKTLDRQLTVAGRSLRVAPQVALVILAIYFAYIVRPGVSGYYQYLTDSRVDTRVQAASWISEHLPADSVVILDTLLSNYLPRVFSANPAVAFRDFDYVYASQNRLLVDGFKYYFTEHRRTSKAFRVAHLNAREWNFDLSKIKLPRSAYIVVSSFTYQRYYSTHALENDPKLTPRARHYYDTLRKFPPVASFTGKGPKIDIYALR